MLAIFLKYLYSLPKAGRRGTRTNESHLLELELELEYDASRIYEPDGVVSVILHRRLKPSIVSTYTLSNTAEHTQTLEGATGYTLVSDQAKKTLDGKSLRKQMTKSTASLEKILCLLRGSTRDAVPCMRSLDAPRIIIGEATFISRPELSDPQKDADMSEIYTKISSQHSSGFNSTQYLKAHCSAIKPAVLDALCAGRFKSININTGLCLFSKSVLVTSPGQGKGIALNEKPVIPPLPLNKKPTLYELEIITRLSSAIADTVGLVGEHHRDGTTPISINVDIPDFQYYWTACELFERNLVAAAYVGEWIGAVDERRRQLEGIVVSMIRTALKDRGLGHVDVQLSSGTEAAVSLVKEMTSIGVVPSLEDIISALKSRGHDAAKWRTFLDNLDARHRPQTVGELSKLMYVFKSVKAALDVVQDTGEAVVEADAPGPSLTIQVDDVNEWRIFDRAKTFLQEHTKRVGGHGPGGAVIIGLFPMQRIFAACRGRSDLYNEASSGDLISAAEKVAISSFDVIEATYGLHVARRLRHFCKREGLI